MESRDDEATLRRERARSIVGEPRSVWHYYEKIRDMERAAEAAEPVEEFELRRVGAQRKKKFIVKSGRQPSCEAGVIVGDQENDEPMRIKTRKRKKKKKQVNKTSMAVGRRYGTGMLEGEITGKGHEDAGFKKQAPPQDPYMQSLQLERLSLEDLDAPVQTEQPERAGEQSSSPAQLNHDVVSVIKTMNTGEEAAVKSRYDLVDHLRQSLKEMERSNAKANREARLSREFISKAGNTLHQRGRVIKQLEREVSWLKRKERYMKANTSADFMTLVDHLQNGQAIRADPTFMRPEGILRHPEDIEAADADMQSKLDSMEQRMYAAELEVLEAGHEQLADDAEVRRVESELDYWEEEQIAEQEQAERSRLADEQRLAAGLESMIAEKTTARQQTEVSSAQAEERSRAQHAAVAIDGVEQGTFTAAEVSIHLDQEALRNAEQRVQEAHDAVDRLYEQQELRNTEDELDYWSDARSAVEAAWYASEAAKQAEVSRGLDNVLAGASTTRLNAIDTHLCDRLGALDRELNSHRWHQARAHAQQSRTAALDHMQDARIAGHESKLLEADAREHHDEYAARIAEEDEETAKVHAEADHWERLNVETDLRQEDSRRQQHAELGRGIDDLIESLRAPSRKGRIATMDVVWKTIMNQEASTKKSQKVRHQRRRTTNATRGSEVEMLRQRVAEQDEELRDQHDLLARLHEDKEAAHVDRSVDHWIEHADRNAHHAALASQAADHQLHDDISNLIKRMRIGVKPSSHVPVGAVQTPEQAAVRRGRRVERRERKLKRLMRSNKRLEKENQRARSEIGELKARLKRIDEKRQSRSEDDQLKEQQEEQLKAFYWERLSGVVAAEDTLARQQYDLREELDERQRLRQAQDRIMTLLEQREQQLIDREQTLEKKAKRASVALNRLRGSKFDMEANRPHVAQVVNEYRDQRRRSTQLRRRSVDKMKSKLEADLSGMAVDSLQKHGNTERAEHAYHRKVEANLHILAQASFKLD